MNHEVETYGTHSLEIEKYRDETIFKTVRMTLACKKCKSYSSFSVEGTIHDYMSKYDVDVVEREIGNLFRNFREAFSPDCEYQKQMNIVKSIHAT